MVHVPPDVANGRTSPLKTRLVLAGLRLVGAAVGVLPRVAVGEPLCRTLGLVWYLAAPAARAAVTDNLRHILGRAPRAREILAVFQNGALNYWDTFAIPHLTLPGILDLVDIHGGEHIEHARAGGRGVILVTAHLGSVSFVGQIMPALGYPTSGLLEPLDPPELFDFFARQRRALGARLLPVGPAALREMLLALRRNELLGLVSDRDLSGSGPLVPFFDALAHFPDGTASLAVRTGAPMLSAVCTRRADGRFDAWIAPLEAVELTGDRKTDVLALTQAVARRLEYHIATHPEQWTVFQKRWPLARAGGRTASGEARARLPL